MTDSILLDRDEPKSLDGIFRPYPDLPNMFGMDMGWINEVTRENWLRRHRRSLLNIKYGKKIEVTYVD